MKKTFFTDAEIATLTKVLGNKLQVSLNKAGNIKVVNNAELETKRNSHHGFWTLYKFADGTFLWRRHDGIGNCYPLNMKGRKVVHHSYDDYYRPYNVSMSIFNTFDEALKYFVNYLEKYKGIKI